MKNVGKKGGGREELDVLCFALLCSSVSRPEMHWSQPGEKKLTGGQNWQNKTMSTTQWSPAPMAPQPMPVQHVVRTHEGSNYGLGRIIFQIESCFFFLFGHFIILM